VLVHEVQKGLPKGSELFVIQGDYPRSIFGGRGNGWADLLLDAVTPYEALARGAAVRRWRWSAFVHQTPDCTELAAIRRSTETSLPYGERS